MSGNKQNDCFFWATFSIVQFSKIIQIHSVLYKNVIEENFPGLFNADIGQPQALDDIELKKNQF